MKLDSRFKHGNPPDGDGTVTDLLKDKEEFRARLSQQRKKITPKTLF